MDSIKQESIEDATEAERRKRQEFFDLVEQFRSATDPEEARQLGDRLGRAIFGD